MARRPDTVHSLYLVQLMDSQRENASTTDVILVCGGRDFPAHKMVLSVVSPYLRTLLVPGWDESGTGRLDLPSITADEMEIILPFLYTGNITDVSNPSFLKTLLKTTHMMKIEALFEYCYTTLCKGLTCNKFIEIYNLSYEYDDDGMTKHVASFLAKHFISITKSNEFLELTASQLQKVIHNIDLYNCSLDDVMKGVLQWAEFDTEREDSLLDIMTTFHLRDLSPDFLTELLCEQALVKRNHHILTLLTAEAMTRMMACVSKIHGNVNEGKVLCFGKKDLQHVFRLYNASENKWSAPKALAFQLEDGMAVVCFEGFVYAVGGGDAPSNRPSANVIKYNPRSNTIVSTGRLATPVCQAGVGILHKSLYIINGVNEASQGVTTVQRYNPVTTACQELAQTNNSHIRPSVFTFGNSLYVLGSDKEQNSLERYNIESDQWTVVTAIPGEIEWCSAAIFEKKLYVVPSLTMTEFQVYDFASAKWTQKDITGSPAKKHGLYPINLQDKSVLLVRDEKGTLHSYDEEYGLWQTPSAANAEPWSQWMTCLL